MNRSFEARLTVIFTIGAIYVCGRLAEMAQQAGDSGGCLALTLTAGLCGFAMLDPALPR